MKNLWQKRRELFKRLYIRGTRTTKSVDDEVLVATNSSGQGFEKIRIYGKTTYTPLNLSQLLMNEVSKKEMYSSTGTTGVLACGIPDLLCQRELTYTPTLTGDIGNHTVYIADGYNFLFSDTRTLVSGGNCYPVTVKGYPYIIISGLADEADLEGVLSRFTISIEGKNVYDIKSLDDPLVELYGKNLLDLSPNKYSGASPIHEKRENYIKLRVKNNYYSANMRVPIDEFKINKRKLTISASYELTNPLLRGLALFMCVSKAGISLESKSIGTHTKNGAATGQLSSSGTLNSGVTADMLDKYAFCFCFFSNTSGITEYDEAYITYKNPMVRLAETDSDYEEYRPPVKIQVPSLTLASAGGVRDYLEIDKAQGKITYHKLIGDLDIDKGENEQAILENEEIQDFSDTEWAKDLLELNIPYGCDGYLWIEGCGKIQCEYYTVKNENKYTITVSYKDEDENQIEPKKIYHVRHGSAYRITPPHLSGYISLSEEAVGVINQNTEITLIYKKEGT